MQNPATPATTGHEDAAPRQPIEQVGVDTVTTLDVLDMDAVDAEQ